MGYSLFSLDPGTVSWRFKALDSGFPFVLITAPADYRPLRHERQAAQPGFTVRALVFGAQAIEEVRYCLGEGLGLPMRLDEQGVWQAEATGAAGVAASLTLTVEARDATGRLGRHRLLPARAPYQPPCQPGAARIGAWEENGGFGHAAGPQPQRKTKQFNQRSVPTS
ncbi:hypothetical protein ACFQ48_05910 [Hymenobacter caeli]|uniref:Uncharacterized protein n=1 Tax=Hymenobacter caeli TaxID=2735894 RepID=A0ABX2FN60_9BACT|nr:hypothetical protein [Hymenobacter caeli]NRT18584.1 hypothetical protein [Hymenobacter caeli]